MNSRLLYSAILISSVAMLLFVAGFVCLRFGLVLLTSLIYTFAGEIILLSFALLLLLGVLALIVALQRELRAYFSREAAALRRILALQTQHKHLAQRSVLEWRQLQYQTQFKRQRLLAADDKKHLRALFEAVRRELQVMKRLRTGSVYPGPGKVLRHHLKHGDAEAMLALRQRFLCRG